MTIVDPIPDVQYGRGDWQDYISNWREKDAEWIQERTILRYATPTARSTDWSAPRAGHVTYNGLSDRLEMFSGLRSSWVGILMFQYLTSIKDDATAVNISHTASGGKGINIGPSLTSLDNPLNVMGSVLAVDGTGVTVKTGAKTAKLTTDANNLISDTPVSAPGFITAGALTATGNITGASATLTGTLTVPNISLSGTLTGGVLNGTSGLIGGVTLGSNTVQPGGGATGGMQSNQGHFYGDGTSAVMRQRPALGGTWSPTFVQVTANNVVVGGGAPQFFDVNPTMRYYGGKGIQWMNAGGTLQAWISPVIYAASDPGATNFPDGTLWLS
jgi:hypothetical protein